jgi:transposase
MQLTEKQRYEIIFRYEKGNTHKKIAHDMSINIKSVIRWIERYKKNKNVKRISGSGRKKIIMDEIDEKIIVDINQNNLLSAKNIYNNLNENNLKISIKTVVNRLNKNGFVYRKPIEKPLLTEKQKQKRYDWANENVNTDWTKIIFSDEWRASSCEPSRYNMERSLWKKKVD